MGRGFPPSGACFGSRPPLHVSQHPTRRTLITEGPRAPVWSACLARRNRNRHNKMPISDVTTNGSWIIVFDDSAKEIKRMGSSNKEVVGVASDFFVVCEGSWIVTYDENCREIKRMGASNKTVQNASGRTFTTQEGSWIVNYDRNCKEQGRRGK